MRSETLALAHHLKLNQQALAHIARPTANRVKPHRNLTSLFDQPHHDLTNLLDQLIRPVAHRRDLFVRGRETPVFIQISNDSERSLTNLVRYWVHVKLPLKMLRVRKRARQKL